MLGFNNPFGDETLLPWSEEEDEDECYLVSTLPDPEDWLKVPDEHPDPVSSLGDPEDYDPGEQ